MPNIDSLGLYQRVSKSAKRIGVSGSVEDRNKFASNMNKKFYILVNDVLEKRAKTVPDTYIKSKEIKNCFDSLADDIYLLLGQNEGAGIACIRPLRGAYEPHQVYGYGVELPFAVVERQQVLKKADTGTLLHEFRHIFDYIFQPKLAAAWQRFEMLADNLEHFRFYSKHLYAKKSPEQDKDELLSGLKNEINKHFEKHDTPLLERITVLQKFRYSLMTESNAKNDDLFYSIKSTTKHWRERIKNGERVRATFSERNLFYDSDNYLTKTQKQKAFGKMEKAVFKENVESLHDESYFFNEKINILKEIIFEDIMKVRAILKEQANVKELHRQ